MRAVTETLSYNYPASFVTSLVKILVYFLKRYELIFPRKANRATRHGDILLTTALFRILCINMLSSIVRYQKQKILMWLSFKFTA